VCDYGGRGSGPFFFSDHSREPAPACLLAKAQRSAGIHPGAVKSTAGVIGPGRCGWFPPTSKFFLAGAQVIIVRTFPPFFGVFETCQAFLHFDRDYGVFRNIFRTFFTKDIFGKSHPAQNFEEL